LSVHEATDLVLCYSDKDSVWLVAPLIAKLSSVVQGRILKHAGQVLETGNNFWTAKNTKERERYLQKRQLTLFCLISVVVGLVESVNSSIICFM